MAFKKKGKATTRVTARTRPQGDEIPRPTPGESAQDWIQRAFTDSRPGRIAPQGTGPVITPAIEENAEATGAIPLLAFEPQLSRINKILQHWLRAVDNTADVSLMARVDMMTKLSRSLHENLKLATDCIRLLHEIHDIRTFNRVVLDCLKEISPETRLKVVRRLQQAQAEMKMLPGGGTPFHEEKSANG